MIAVPVSEWEIFRQAVERKYKVVENVYIPGRLSLLKLN